MVVVDSSALLPLAWIGLLDLITATFDEIRTTEDVRDEVITDGKRGTASLKYFLEDVTISERPQEADEVASLEGIAIADASVILLAVDREEILLANDKGLLEVAESHGVECWWVSTLLLKSRKESVLTTKKAIDVLYDLVDEGMNLHPKGYSRVQKALRELGD